MRPKPTRPRALETIVLRQGFIFHREGKGAHRVYRHPSGRYTSISFHPGDVPPGTLRKIIEQIGLTVDQFNEMV